MIEVVIDSIRISLISQHRIVMLRDVDGERRLPIWIGPCEAEAITIELQDVEIARPVTHDLAEHQVGQIGERQADLHFVDPNLGLARGHEPEIAGQGQDRAAGRSMPGQGRSRGYGLEAVLRAPCGLFLQPGRWRR